MIQEIKAGLNLDLIIINQINNTMKRLIIFSILGLLLVFLIYKIATFSLFDVEIEELSEIKVPNKNYTVKIYYLPPNATSQSFIQVRKIDEGIESVLANYENYDSLVKAQLVGDSLLMLELFRKGTGILKNKKTSVRLE